MPVTDFSNLLTGFTFASGTADKAPVTTKIIDVKLPLGDLLDKKNEVVSSEIAKLLKPEYPDGHDHELQQMSDFLADRITRVATTGKVSLIKKGEDAPHIAIMEGANEYYLFAEDGRLPIEVTPEGVHVPNAPKDKDIIKINFDSYGKNELVIYSADERALVDLSQFTGTNHTFKCSAWGNANIIYGPDTANTELSIHKGTAGICIPPSLAKTGKISLDEANPSSNDRNLDFQANNKIHIVSPPDPVDIDDLSFKRIQKERKNFNIFFNLGNKGDFNTPPVSLYKEGNLNEQDFVDRLRQAADSLPKGNPTPSPPKPIKGMIP